MWTICSFIILKRFSQFVIPVGIHSLQERLSFLSISSFYTIFHLNRQQVCLHHSLSFIGGQSFITIDSFLASPSFFSVSSITNAQDIREKGTIPQEVQISDLFKSCYLHTLYHSIRNDFPVNASELQRFLTSDCCSSGMIQIDLSPLLRVLPVLTSNEIQSFDEMVVTMIDSMNCLMFKEWLVVRCDSFPTFIRMDIVHSKRNSTSNEVGCIFGIPKIVS